MKLRRIHLQLFVALCTLCVPELLSAQLSTLNISVSKDSYTDSYAPTTNYGSDTTLKVGTHSVSSTVYYRRSFLYFDLSGIPADKEISSMKIIMRRSASVSGSPSYYAHRITTSWSESTITHNNQPTLSSLSEDQSNWVNTSGDTIKYNVTYMGKRMYWGLKTNEGFCIHLQNETTATNGTEFYSQESVTFEPYLEVTYYDPFHVSDAAIIHASTNTAADGSIDPSLGGGASSSYTYSWINGATGSVLSSDSILDSLSYGWYGVHITGSYGEDIYQAFLVGVECDTVTMTYRPDGNYTANCYVYDGVQNGVDYKNVNFKNSALFLARHQYISNVWRQTESFLDFNLWMDPRFGVLQADMTLQGNAHAMSNYRSNACELLRVTEWWDEQVPTYINQPAADTIVYSTVSAVTTATEDKTVDISNFWNAWKANNPDNYGFKFQLQDTTTNLAVVQNYHSPNNSTSANRPEIEFTLDLMQEGNPYRCYSVYANVERKLSGTKYYSYDNVLHFSYENEYNTASGYLNYRIFSAANRITPVMDNVSDPLAVEVGKNLFDLDVSGLTSGNVYLLEVENDKGEKWFLRFEMN